MEAKVKSARIVPTSSSGNNLLATVFGDNVTGTGRKSDAWSDNEHVSEKVNKAQEEDPSEPFIVKESESESSVESDRLFKKPKTRIYSIDLERNVPKDKRDRKIRGSVLSTSECSTTSHTSSSGSANECKQDSHFDAKLVDKFVRTNRKRRKRKDAKTALVKLCQCCPWTVPWSLLVISAIQICTYVFNNDTFYQLLIFSPVLQHEIWRFVTYTFLHANAVHLMLNVIIQIIVAFPLETEQGHGAVLVVYFAGVIAGGMGASVFEPTQMVGASAGVYCLLISHVPHIVMNFQSLSHRYFRIMAVLVLCVSDVIYSIRHCMTKGNLQPRIGVPAHVSGAICGLLIGFIVYQGEKLMHFRIARYGAMVLLSGWVVATIMYNMQVRA
ncbi:rhomboid-related protein 1 [Ochlerotatus camptorhynchus]|uniref:rhomboid-related protein 1 n=1 Tax=Ochlerotatus camptorhynchus TaxID=644619 RepID=UPI0031E34BB6